MEKLKAIGGTLLGLVIFTGLIIFTVLFFKYGAQIAFAIAPFVNWLTGILFAINLLLVFIAIIPRARVAVGVALFISSYVYGLSVWIYGLAVTLALWGWVAVIIGIFLGGVGVVPIGIVAALFNGQWVPFWALIIMSILTIGTRIVGMLLIESVEERPSVEQEIIDVEPTEPQRNWKDIE